jgi:hypothetical protein
MATAEELEDLRDEKIFKGSPSSTSSMELD